MFIGLAGPSGSGKTLFTKLLEDHLHDNITILSTDNYFIDTKGASDFNFDIPTAIDWDLLKNNVVDLLSGYCIDEPIYSYSEYTVIGYQRKCPNRLILLEGIFALYDESLNSLMDYRIFIYSPLNICVNRRIRRDIYERKRDIEESIRWMKNVLDGAVKYVLPSVMYADMVIMNYPDEAGINRIQNVIDFIIEKLKEL